MRSSAASDRGARGSATSASSQADGAPTPHTPTPGAPEREAVAAMFDRIAPRYDLLNACLSFGSDTRWRRAGVEALGLATGARVLDLCTGTADILATWLERDERNHGVGVDLSLGMLQAGADKLRSRGLDPRSALLAADAVKLPFTSGAFDGAIVAFGLRNVSAWPDAVRELVRVLRPGGALVALEFGWPKGFLGRLYGAYFCHVLPRIGGRLSGDRQAYTYLPASVRRFPPVAEFAAALGSAGLSEITWRPLSLGIAWLCRARKPL